MNQAMDSSSPPFVAMLPASSLYGYSLTRPLPALLRGGSGYRVPKTLFQGHSNIDEYTRSVMMTQFLFRRFQELGWLQQDEKADNPTPLGIIMRVPDEDDTKFIMEPQSIDENLKTICANLNVAVMFTMSSDITSLLFSRVTRDASEITLEPNNITVPVVDSLEGLAKDGAGVRRRDFCCFVREPRIVLVWSNSADEVMLQGAEVEIKLMSSIWGFSIPDNPSTTCHHSRKHTTIMTSYAQQPPSVYSAASTVSTDREEEGEKLAVVSEIDLGAEDEESLAAPARPFLLSHSVMVGLAFGLLTIIECLAVRLIVIEVHALGTVAIPRLALLVTIPIFMFFTLFITVVVAGTGFQIFGPIGDVKTGNSRYYSSRAPNIKRHPNIEFPHITIQMPVYKERLKGVIIPTVSSLLPAIRHYENLGGSASIYICEDGMQAVKPEVAEMRRQFYRANKIGWSARPAHGKDGFLRAGKFKKASNMNYCLGFSLRVEDKLLSLLKEKSELEKRSQEEFTIEEEEHLYGQALSTMIEADNGMTMAEGNVRMGDIILIIDCDTRVPVDCLSLGAMEMEESAEVAIIQHASGVMQVIHTVFENAIAYFTTLVYVLIKFSVGSGDCSPFVGHNAFLRWKAIQSVAFTDENGQEKFWSENHVSEDFDMSLRLQTAGFVIRLSTYDNGEFKESVSLTAFDELLRWEKYAYGCSELIFHPLHQWIYRGPFTALFIRFLRSNIKVSAKFTIVGYIGTYYAIGASLPLSIINYFLTGWFADVLDHSYLPSWDMLCGTLFVFLIVSPIAFAWYRHRLGEKMFFLGLVEAFTWLPFFIIFFGGLSWHISYALLAHMFALPIEWSSTAKELDDGGMFVGMERVWQAFRFVIIFMVVLSGCIIYLALHAPVGWKISAWTSIVPLANQIVGHCMLPVMTIFFLDL